MADIDLGSVAVALARPLRISPWRDADSTQQPARDHANLTLLNGLAALDWPTGEHLAHQDDAPQLQRLEAKLDLGLQLLAQLLGNQTALPPTQSLLLSAQALAWRDPNPPPADDLHLELFIDARIPQPLQLKGRLDRQDGDYWIVRFCAVPDAVQDGLDRAVFRWHRRQVQAGQTSLPSS